jgi:hypothetical protein
MVLSTWKVVLGGVAVVAGVAEAFAPTGLAPHSRLGLRGAPGAAIGRRMGGQAVGPVMDLDWYKVNPSAQLQRTLLPSTHKSAQQGEGMMCRRSSARALVQSLRFRMRCTPSTRTFASSPPSQAARSILLRECLTMSEPTVQAEKGEELPGGGNKYTFTVDVSLIRRLPHVAKAIGSAARA